MDAPIDGILWARERGKIELGWKFEMGLTGLKAHCQQDHVPSEISRGEAMSLPSPAPRVCVPPLIHGSLPPSSKPAMGGLSLPYTE